jgi:hypothetical protein
MERNKIAQKGENYISKSPWHVQKWDISIIRKIRMYRKFGQFSHGFMRVKKN